eukprot:gnl/MRDRNA2_/MRDRNA2_118003_c0_seq1.p1 gnl/MRDRNA2_/MRDRNA2_118003_c0~~gnl/MRDRNA2_/MRDRNA2_118003_c0_seq1.p1  ORF type:complete len:487 (-),score=101.78 gnl/MRDRNA2_/MRDRNA2_118003_c0_seq1:49-1509(-)
MVEVTRQELEGWLEAGNDFGDPVSTAEEAEEICTQNLDKVVGYYWDEDYPDVFYIKKLGTAFSEGTTYRTVLISKKVVVLPLENLFCDTYTEGCLADAEEMEVFQEWGSQPCEWLRPGRGDGFEDTEELKLFGQIHPNDLKQGAIGDCWLIATFAAFAEFPEFLMKIFEQRTLADDGRYVLNFYDHVQKKPFSIEVDDRLPTQGNKTVFLEVTEDHEIWPCLLEKAVAAIYGGYLHGIEAAGDDDDHCSSQGTMMIMTGCTEVRVLRQCPPGDEDEGCWAQFRSIPDPKRLGSCVDHPGQPEPWDDGSTDPKEPESFFQLLAEWDAKSYVMICGDNPDVDNPNAGKLVDGIVQCHMYSLIAVKPDVAGSGVDLLQVRNPWGEESFKGMWQVGSPDWDEHPEVFEELQPDTMDTGLFWMSKEDFFDHFGEVTVVMKSMQEASRTKKSERAVKANPELPSGVKKKGGGGKRSKGAMKRSSCRVHCPIC